MKQQWSSENNIEPAFLEEGSYEEKQKCIKRIEYKTNCCLRCIPYLRLIFLLEVTLFFGWGCYMILQTYFPQVMENDATSITLERYPSVIESLSEIQETRPSAEMPAIFVKHEVIIDKINNFLEDMKYTKDQYLMQNKTIITDAVSRVQTSTQNSSNNIAQKYDVNRLLATLLSGNVAYDKKFTKSSMPERFSSIELIDKEANTHKENKSLRHLLFFKKLRSIINEVKATNDLEKIESRNDLTEDVDYLKLKSHENPTSNKPGSLEFNIATILNLGNFVNHTSSVNLTKALQDLEYSDLTKDAAQDDRSEDSSLFDETDEKLNAPLKLDFIVYPLCESHELSHISIQEPSKSFSASQPVLPQEQIQNESSDSNDERNENKHDVNDSDMSMSASAFGNQDYFDTSVITVQSTEEQHLSESIAKIIEDEYESMQSTAQDSTEFSPNIDEFQWFNGPALFADLDRGDISKLSETHSSLFRDKVDIDDVIPESQCEITIKMGILKVKCPAIKFDEEWNFISSEIPPTVVDNPKVINFGDIFDDFLHTECDEVASKQLEIENISNENSDKGATTSRNNVPKRIDIIELQESTTSAKILNEALLDEAAYIDPSDIGDSDKNFEFYSFPLYDLNEEEVKHEKENTTSSFISELSSSIIDSNKRQNPFLDISGTQQEQLKISEEQDDSVSNNSETFLKDLKHFYDLKKNLTSLFKNEMSNIMTRYQSESSYENNYRNSICNIVRYMHTIPQHLWREQYIALSKLLEYIRNPDYPHSTEDYYQRKKRMADDLTWQHDQVSNTLEEDNENVDLLENLKKLFQKMEILALCIDRLHERYLLHNKLDDDYASSEFSIESEERRESYTPKVVYEK